MKNKNASKFLIKFISRGLKKFVLERHIKQANVQANEAPVAASIPNKIKFLNFYFKI